MIDKEDWSCMYDIEQDYNFVKKLRDHFIINDQSESILIDIILKPIP